MDTKSLRSKNWRIISILKLCVLVAYLLVFFSKKKCNFHKVRLVLQFLLVRHYLIITVIIRATDKFISIIRLIVFG